MLFIKLLTTDLCQFRFPQEYMNTFFSVLSILKFFTHLIVILQFSNLVNESHKNHIFKNDQYLLIICNLEI